MLECDEKQVILKVCLHTSLVNEVEKELGSGSMNQIKGNGFIITEENGNYTMSWMTGGFQDREVTYSVSKELVDKALRSEQDAYEVELFLQTGDWVTKESKEIARQNYFRSTPTRILVNPSSVKRLFSNQEFG